MERWFGTVALWVKTQQHLRKHNNILENMTFQKKYFGIRNVDFGLTVNLSCISTQILNIPACLSAFICGVLERSLIQVSST